MTRIYRFTYSFNVGEGRELLCRFAFEFERQTSTRTRFRMLDCVPIRYSRDGKFFTDRGILGGQSMIVGKSVDAQDEHFEELADAFFNYLESIGVYTGRTTNDNLA